MVIKINNNAKYSEELVLSRFDRQTREGGWGIEEQKKIFNRKVVVVGSGNLGEMTLASLLSLGAKNILYFDSNSKRFSKSYFSNTPGDSARLEKIINVSSKINPYAKICGYKSPFTELFLRKENFKPDIIIDTTNSLESKESILNYIDKNKGVDFISGSSDLYSCSVLGYNKNNSNEILGPGINLEAPQGGFTSNIAAGLLSEEFRKSIFTLEPLDKRSEEEIYYNILSGGLNTQNTDLSLNKFNKNGNILIAGSGGIGSYVGLGLAQEGFRNLTFLDMDTIEDSNLNRQMFFYDKIGAKKSHVLRDRFNLAFKINATSVDQKLTEKNADEYFKRKNFDMIFGCFDNNNARLFLSDYSERHRVPYIDGGTSFRSGQINTYIPEKTLSVKAKRGMRLEEEVVREGCDNAMPSVISPNMVIGSAMVGEAINYLGGNMLDRKIVYNTNSKKKIKAAYLESKCNKGGA